MATRGYDIPGPWDAGYPAGMDWDKRIKDENDALSKLEAVAAKATEKDPKGFLLNFGVADGSATYVVTKLRPLTLCHVPHGDGYQIPDAHLRGINLDDVRQQIVWRDKWASLASKNTEVDA